MLSIYLKTRLLDSRSTVLKNERCVQSSSLRPFKSNEFGHRLRSAACEMLTAFRQDPNLINDYLQDIILERQLPHDTTNFQAVEALGSVATWFRKPEYVHNLSSINVALVM